MLVGGQVTDAFEGQVAKTAELGALSVSNIEALEYQHLSGAIDNYKVPEDTVRGKQQDVLKKIPAIIQRLMKKKKHMLIG